jgi:hypothetical protein
MQSFASLGLTPGSYLYHWGSGANADSLTIEIGNPGGAVPEASTWAMMPSRGDIPYTPRRQNRAAASRMLTGQGGRPGFQPGGIKTKDGSARRPF